MQEAKSELGTCIEWVYWLTWRASDYPPVVASVRLYIMVYSFPLVSLIEKQGYAYKDNVAVKNETCLAELKSSSPIHKSDARRQFYWNRLVIWYFATRLKWLPTALGRKISAQGCNCASSRPWHRNWQIKSAKQAIAKLHCQRFPWAVSLCCVREISSQFTECYNDREEFISKFGK